MRIIITGGSGFIGSHLCERFLAEGHQVVAVDNLITGSTDNIAHLVGNENFQFIKHNVSNYIFVPGEVDMVMHFASPASPIDYLMHPIPTLKVGALGTHNALGLALANNAKFMLASTSEIYGDPLEHPQKESYNGNVDAIGPRGVYDEAKRYGEALTMAYHRAHGLDTRIIRIFNTYGPRMRMNDGRVVPNFIKQAIQGKALSVYGDGSQTRAFQYVDDLVEGISRLLFNVTFHEPVNLGTTREINMLEFAEIVNRVAENPAGIIMEPDKRIEGDPQRRKPDITRAKELLGWEPKVPLEDGLKQTIAHFRDKV